MFLSFYHVIRIMGIEGKKIEQNAPEQIVIGSHLPDYHDTPPEPNVERVVLFDPHPIFTATINCESSTIIHAGGTSSGKTYTILQVLLFWAITCKNLRIMVVGQDLPNLKDGPIADTAEIIKRQPIISRFITQHNKTDQIYYFSTGSYIKFKSYSDAQDAHSGKRDIVFINEANGIEYGIFEELQVRTTQKMILDYNPTAEFWAHEKLIGKEDVTTFYSNFTMNPYVQDSIIKKILQYKVEDKFRWGVYGLGKTGVVEGVIHKKFRKVDRFPPQATRIIYGLDFGFSNDPTALVRTGKYRGEIYGEELCYKTKMTTKDIVQMFRDNRVSYSDPIIADSAEPRLIQELCNYGYNVIGAKKGDGSVLAGIDLINQWFTNITRASLNWIKEQKNYVYKKIKGVYVNEPVKKWDHLMNAYRYAITYGYGKRPKRKPRSYKARTFG